MDNELRIRNVDSMVLARLDQLAKEKNMSRNQYVKQCLEVFSIQDFLTESQSKYENLVVAMMNQIEANNSLLQNLDKGRNENA